MLLAHTRLGKFSPAFFKMASFACERQSNRVRVGRSPRKSEMRVPTERCKYPVSACAERECKSERVVGGRHRIYYSFDITKCAIDYALMIVNIPFPLWRNADVNPKGILGDGTEYIIILILRNVPSVSSLQSFFFGLLLQRKSVKRFSGRSASLDNVQFGCRGGVSPPVSCVTVCFVDIDCYTREGRPLPYG